MKKLVGPGIEEGPWDCREFGGRVMIVTRHHGSRVVLSASPRGELMTRDRNGTLRPLEIDHPVARFLAGSKSLASALERIHETSGDPAIESIARNALIAVGYRYE